MNDQLWVVRAGKGAMYADQAVAKSIIAIGFDNVTTEDLSATDAEHVRSLATTPSLRTHANQLINFAFKMHFGDFVIMPRLTKAHRDYLVARVVGDYEYDQQPSDWGRHRRRVEWLGAIPFDTLSKSATNSLGGIATVFRPASAEAEIRGQLTSLAPMGGVDAFPSVTHALRKLYEPVGTTVPPVAVGPPPKELATARLEIEVAPSGSARIVSAYPALIMEQTPRHLDPSRDWASVPGIYVLTGTELQQSVVRTGNERTLTTTSIVRPWAYVGLSEDIHGRLSSHRTTKDQWRRALLVRSGGQPFSGDDIRYLELKVHSLLGETEEVAFEQAVPRGNISAQPRNTQMLDACAETVVAVLRLTGTLI